MSAWNRSGSVSTGAEEDGRDCRTTGVAISSSSPLDVVPDTSDVQGIMVGKASAAMPRAKAVPAGDPSLFDTGRSEVGSDMPIGRGKSKKQGKSPGVFAKIKGRLGRHAG